MALYGYSLQVYADFSGYTDMAIGVALLMGYRLPQNFNSPYKADSCGDFWKRWHMSLSGWLKDYLYIPMGGNRRASGFTAISAAFLLTFVVLMVPDPAFIGGLLGTLIGGGIAMARIPRFHRWVTTNVNIWMTMLLGGLWHGASWNFVIWGGLNGLGITVYKLWRKSAPGRSKTAFGSGPSPSSSPSTSSPSRASGSGPRRTPRGPASARTTTSVQNGPPPSPCWSSFSSPPKRHSPWRSVAIMATSLP